MADLTVRRSRSVDIELALTVLDGFLAGFGVHSPELRTQFSGATETCARRSHAAAWSFAGRWSL